MKKSVWYLVGVLILTLALVAVACAKQAAKEATPTEKAPAPVSGTVHQVTIKDFAFSPQQITIKVSDTVTWTNQDSAPHTATGSGFNSGNLANGQSWSYTFNAVGTFTYKCTIHPSIQGQVTVESGGISQAATEATSAPAAFTTSNLTISPTEVDTGKSVTISVLITNSGGLTGSYNVTLKIDNVAVATKDVTLAGGASQAVTFVTAKDVAGTYTVNVDGLSGTFTVKTASTAAPTPAGGTVYQVTIKDFVFSPNQITIKVGDTVTWTNQDSAPHTVTGSGFNSGNLANGQSWSYTFNAIGTFTYRCIIHPSMQQGQVTVESGGASGGQSGDYGY